MKTRRVVHPVKELGKMYGEFHHLFWQCRNHPGR